MNEMSTQQYVIKAFLRSLDNTKLSGAKAVDEAVKYCSGGKYSSMQDLIDRFVADVAKYGNDSYSDSKPNVFLKDCCGILLDNDDTGSISGADAGGTEVKTAESIVPESEAVSTYPSGGRTTIDGLTFIWPDRDSLSDDERAIADRLYSWWAKGALDLIQESFGMSFQEADASVKEISLSFYNDVEDNALASVSHTSYESTGKTTELQLNVNMHYYGGFDKLDVNGVSGSTQLYLDRTLAHEFVHAVMAANIDNFAKLPHFVTEGLAELVHGIDDFRVERIKLLSTKEQAAYIRKMLETELYKDDQIYNDAYAGGYMLFRYLAKQLDNVATASNLPIGVSYNEDETAVTIRAPFSGIWDSGDYAATLSTIDASQDVNPITIKAGASNSVIKAGMNGSNIYGQGGNDTIYGGKGKDTFHYANGDGNDTIKDYGSGVDVVQVSSGSVTTQVSGYDLVLKVGKGSVRIADGTLKNVLLKEGSKAIRTIKGFKKLSTMASYNTDQTAVTLKSSAKGTFDARSYNTAIRNIDGRAAASSVNIYGNDADNVIRAGKKGGILRGFGGNDSIYGGAGNDSIYGGTGKDTFYYANGGGKDTVNDYESNKDVIQLVSGAVSKTTVYGDDVTFTVGKGSIKVAGGVGKTILLKDAKGKITKVKKDYKALPKGASYASKNTKVTLTSAFAGTFDSQAYRGSIRTIDGRKATSRAINIYGNGAVNTIYAGSKGGVLRGFGGNDTLYGGKGTDTFYYANGDGNDVINGYESNKDIIQIGSGSISKTTAYGSDVTFTVGKGSIKVVGGAGKTFRIKDAKGKITTKRVDYRALPSGASYGANYTKVTMSSGFTGNFDARAYRPTIQTVDASKAAKAVTLYGNSKANRLVGGKGGSVLRGMGGNDTLVGGVGEDKFYFGKGDGNITIENFDSLKDKIVFSDSEPVSYGGNASSKTFYFKLSTGKTVTIRGGFGQWIEIIRPNGNKSSYRLYRERTLKETDKGVFKVANQSTGICDIDASSSRYATTLYGTAGDNKFYASKGGSQIYAGNGRDTIYCNAGKDTIYLNRYGYGCTEIYNLQKNDILYLQGVSGVGDYSQKLKNGVLSLNFKGSSMQVQVNNWQKGQSLQVIYGNAGSKHTITV